MPNVLKVTVENPDELLNAGAYDAGALIQIQSSTTETQPGTFADISGTGSTPTIAIVAATRSYTGYDPNGTSATWYRTRYKNAAGTRASDWSASFQVGDETAGLLCSLYDVQQELGEGTTDANRNEFILDKIRQVSAAIEGYCERWLAPRPTNPASTAIYTFDIERPTRCLPVPKGVRSITTLETASLTGGSYSTVSSTGYFLRPLDIDRNVGWPATSVEMSDITGAYFYAGYNTVRVTGSFGWAAVPADIQGVAIRATVRRVLGKGGGGVVVGVGPEGSTMLLPDMSGADRIVLGSYRRIPV